MDSAIDGGGRGVTLLSRMLALLELGTSTEALVAAVMVEPGLLRSKSVGMGACEPEPESLLPDAAEG